LILLKRALIVLSSLATRMLIVHVAAAQVTVSRKPEYDKYPIKFVTTQIAPINRHFGVTK